MTDPLPKGLRGDIAKLFSVQGTHEGKPTVGKVIGRVLDAPRPLGAGSLQVLACLVDARLAHRCRVDLESQPLHHWCGHPPGGRDRPRSSDHPYQRACDWAGGSDRSERNDPHEVTLGEPAVRSSTRPSPTVSR